MSLALVVGVVLGMALPSLAKSEMGEPVDLKNPDEECVAVEEYNSIVSSYNSLLNETSELRIENNVLNSLLELREEEFDINHATLSYHYDSSTKELKLRGVDRILVIIGRTNSMYPTFSEGNLIPCKNAGFNTIKKGDVIAFTPLNGTGVEGADLAVHRVFDIQIVDGVKYLVTMGDNQNEFEYVSENEERLTEGTYEYLCAGALWGDYE